MATARAQTRRLAPPIVAVGVRRPLPQESPGFDRGSRAFPVGAALAAMRRLKAIAFDSGRIREQARSHRRRSRSQVRGSAGVSRGYRLGLNQAPRTAHGRCRGQKTPPTKSPGFGRVSGAFPVAAALAATRLWLAARHDQGSNLESKPPPHPCSATPRELPCWRRLQVAATQHVKTVRNDRPTRVSGLSDRTTVASYDAVRIPSVRCPSACCPPLDREN